MRRSLFSLILLIALWSLFYAGFKYFFWGIYDESVFAPSLERITGFVLLGSMTAYAIGGFLYARYGERNMLFTSIFLGALFFLGGLLLPSLYPKIFDISMIGLGFAYSLYVIGKNTLIGREISTSRLGSSTVGAYTTVTFIVFLILGTILGAKIGEDIGGIYFGAIYFLSLLMAGAVNIYFSPQSSLTGEFRFSWVTYKNICVRYGIYMIALGCFWQISVEVSQVAIQYSKEIFHKTNFVSSLLLIFSSVGAILGNILSVKLSHNRSISFLILGFLFVLVTGCFSMFLSLSTVLENYVIVQGLAGVVGFFFGAAVNLAESHFFALLGEDDDKDHISALYGFVLSLVGVLMMFVSEKILSTGSYIGISLFLGCIALFGVFGGWKGINIHSK